MPKLYCLYCKTNRDLLQAEEKQTSNGRLRMEGICKVCNKRISSFVSQKKGGCAGSKRTAAKKS